MISERVWLFRKRLSLGQVALNSTGYGIQVVSCLTTCQREAYTLSQQQGQLEVCTCKSPSEGAQVAIPAPEIKDASRSLIIVSSPIIHEEQLLLLRENIISVTWLQPNQ